MKFMKEFVFVYLIWNLAVFFIYGADKFLAKRRARRISERALLTSAFAMGAVGAAIGMYVFHHKTRRRKFRILIPLFTIFNALLIIVPYAMQY